MEKNIIKIQRYFRIYKLHKLFNNFENSNIKKRTGLTFQQFTNKMRNKNIITNVNNIVNSLNKLCGTNFKVSARVILTAFLINNYTNDIIGPLKDRHPIDIYVIDWSKKLVNIFHSENSIYEYKLMINYLNNYNDVFNNWKQIDKNRTIQNIIISYGNRIDHINYVIDEEMDDSAKEKIIVSLNEESDTLLESIQLMEPSFDIDNLKINYKKIIEDIKNSMEKIFTDLSYNFKQAYLDILIEEFTNDNSNIILNLINETNERLLLLTPKEYLDSTRSKLLSFKYTDCLLENHFEDLIEYFYFIIDTIIVYSPPEDDEVNSEWKIDMLNWLNSDADLDYKILIPSLLLEINGKIDIIIYKLNKLI